MSSAGNGGYDFSQLFHASHLSYSPGSTFLATVHLNKIIIRSSSTLSIVRIFQCLLPPESSSKVQPLDIAIDQLLWSSDSLYLIAYSGKVRTGWLFGLTQDGRGEGGEVARLGGEGVDGLVKVEWGKGDREILTWSDYGLHLTIHDLMTGETRQIQHPRSPNNCHTYSPDSRHLAVLERHSGKDFVGIYDTQDSYALLRHFPLGLNNAQEISWSPCGRYIAASDDSIHYLLHLYTPLGTHLVSFDASSPSFNLESASHDPALGIRCFSWAPGGRWILIAGWDGKVRVVESEGGRCVAIMAWPNRTIEAETVVWSEPRDWLRDCKGHGIVQFDRVKTPASLPFVKSDFSHFPPRSGVSHICFDTKGTYFFVRQDTQPSLLHVHSFLPSAQSSSPDIKHIAVLLFSQPIRSATWCLTRRKLAIATRSGAVFFWDGDGGWVDDDSMRDSTASESKAGMMEAVGIPTRVNFKTSDIVWSPDGTSLGILDKSSTQFCLLYEEYTGDTSSALGVETTSQRRWDGIDQLSHVMEEDEDEAVDASVLTSLAETEALWTQRRNGILA
ncbi:hypothetical protein BD324DRAFT_582386 [Kockovaella imperatae]|uniref:WD40-repeat-containing domain protein n=1 Tax=Kockovaella imperatae TaxID=4999 RepID=A0A1Y1UEF4_9TREE|nr:hypothetical protein BD324DRAFT_582386 [Kockovaella imperatae]ORX35455.1 hypothetical protein BD324DRAFT_582386 [Kockovaella imperatae]